MSAHRQIRSIEPCPDQPVTSKVVIDEVLDRGMLEVLPLTHIRGRSLHDSFVIVD